MLDAFKTVAAGRDPATVHWEHFSTGSRVAGDSYTIELARNGQTFFVPAGKSVLDILIAAGLEVAYGCKQGICGACQTNVLDGIPQHNDMVLSDEERASNKIVMICCSGAVSERLVLDL
jgi:vanillate O-demethylase ferredoxin subunit